MCQISYHLEHALCVTCVLREDNVSRLGQELTCCRILQFLHRFIGLLWQMFGRWSRLARSELMIQLQRTREMDLPSGPKQWFVTTTGGARTGRREPGGAQAGQGTGKF